MRKLIAASSFAFFVFLLLALLGWFYANHYYKTPLATNAYGNQDNISQNIMIPKGSSLKSIAELLAREEIIKHPQFFYYMARFTGQTNPKHGEYEFTSYYSPKAILEKLEKGDVVIRKFTIPEGRTSYDIIEILKSAEGLAGELPETIAEGSILPSTYFYHYGDKYETIIARMQHNMQTTVEELWKKRAEGLPINTPEEAIILASIVEKETGLDGERGMVASVFTNRLRKGMRLESDPTAVYGITLGKPLDEKVRAKHVRHESPYNTYLIDRLPPTPIAAPGIESIKAVLNPPETPYYYFVANGKGGHNFAKNLNEHNKNVRTLIDFLKKNQN